MAIIDSMEFYIPLKFDIFTGIYNFSRLWL
jgi:hypothetical protein